jgi:mitogen-activated protein kinase kinase 5
VDNGATDWPGVFPDEVTFSDCLDVISRVLPPGIVVPAFDYVDEDGDRITVRSDDELKLMMFSYVSLLAEHNGTSVTPLIIYPKVGKPAGKRNIFGLKVQTRTSSSDGASGPGSAMVIDEHSGADGSRKRSGDIREILKCGTIGDGDVHYLHVLGTGSCGTVYKALHKLSGRLMAVKVIPLDISRDAQKQIISELEILYKCNSPVIISFYGAFFLENRISMCTEFMDGGSLDTYKDIPENILGPISVSIVRGLQYLWSFKIMHRDVKPSNILVNTKGEVKLCDFGVSVQLIDSIAKTFIGTNAYMAPERIKGEEYSIHSEVWSLGVSLFEMAAGSFPYDSGKTPGARGIDLWKSIVEKEPPQLPHSRFSENFVDFVSKCMRKDPPSRPAPEALMRHPFIEQYKDSNNTSVALWVQTRLTQLQPLASILH